MGCTPGSKRHHTSVISRCLNLILCTRHQYKYAYHIAGCRHHHEFILLSRQVSSIRQSSRFVSGRLWVQLPHLAPPFRFYRGVMAPSAGQVWATRRAISPSNQISGWHKLAERFCSGQTPRCKAMAEQRHTASKLFRMHLRAGNSPLLAGFKAVFTAVLTRSIRHESDRQNFQLASKHLSNW